MVEEPLYYYNIREDSTTNQKNSSDHDDCIKAADIIRQEIDDRDIKDYDEEVYILYLKLVLNSLRKYITMYNNINISNLDKVKKILDSLYPQCMKNRYYYSFIDAFDRKVAELLYYDVDSLIKQYSSNVLDKNGLSYQLYYEQYIEAIDAIFEYCKMKHYKVAIWGAGLKGNDFLKAIDADKSKVSIVIDKDKRKNGTRTQSGHLIVNNIEKDQVDFIIIMNKYYYANIKEEIKNINKSMLVLNLEIYLLLKETNLGQCID